MSELAKIAKEQIRKAEAYEGEQIRKVRAYDSLQYDLKDVQHHGEPVRECVLRLKYEALHLASLEAHRAWIEERNARVGTDCIGSVPATYQPEASS